MNDADILTAEFHAAGRMMAAKVCPICEDFLADEFYGPHSNEVEGYHDECAREAWGL